MSCHNPKILFFCEWEWSFVDIFVSSTIKHQKIQTNTRAHSRGRDLVANLVCAPGGGGSDVLTRRNTSEFANSVEEIQVSKVKIEQV